MHVRKTKTRLSDLAGDAALRRQFMCAQRQTEHGVLPRLPSQQIAPKQALEWRQLP
jgi:hypothetical protein